MRRSIVTVTLLGLALVGCSEASEPAAPVTVTETEQATASTETQTVTESAQPVTVNETVVVTKIKKIERDVVSTVTIAPQADGSEVTLDGDPEQLVPVGTTVPVNTAWNVSVSETNTDAYELALSANGFQDPPPTGSRMVLVNVSATYSGPATSTLLQGLDFSYQGSGGNFYSVASDFCGIIPDNYLEASEVASGATTSGNICVIVPEDQIAGGGWRIRGNDGSDGVVFAGA